jgi:hypothetical protein
VLTPAELAASKTLSAVIEGRCQQESHQHIRVAAGSSDHTMQHHTTGPDKNAECYTPHLLLVADVEANAPQRKGAAWEVAQADALKAKVAWIGFAADTAERGRGPDSGSIMQCLEKAFHWHAPHRWQKRGKPARSRLVVRTQQEGPYQYPRHDGWCKTLTTDPLP